MDIYIKVDNSEKGHWKYKYNRCFLTKSPDEYIVTGVDAGFLVREEQHGHLCRPNLWLTLGPLYSSEKDSAAAALEHCGSEKPSLESCNLGSMGAMPDLDNKMKYHISYLEVRLEPMVKEEMCLT